MGTYFSDLSLFAFGLRGPYPCIFFYSIQRKGLRRGYVQTPLGVYEIKHFFNTGIAMDEGDDMSKRSVKQRIEEIIQAEKSDVPLSDQEIFRMLNSEGIQLARRTVTKYREELGIKPARFRKRSAVA